MQPAHYLHIFPRIRDNEALLFSLPRCSTMIMPEASLDAFMNSNIPPDAAEQLARAGFMVTDHETEKSEVHSYIDRLNAINTTVRVSVILNMACNFDCRYCYEGSLKGDHYMDIPTADKLIALLKEEYDKPGKNKMSLDLYGGEPMLSLPLIKYIAGKLQPWVEEQGGSFEFTLVTNGSLITRAKVKRLVQFGLARVRVTLDGPKENHNKYRPFKSGDGSYDLIIRNLLDICDLVKVVIGGNFTSENYRMFPDLLDDLLERGLTPDKVATVKFSPVSNTNDSYGPKFNEGCGSITEPWLAGASLFLREEILKRGYTTARLAPNICMVDVDDSFVINYDGSLCKCPGLIGNDRFRIGDLDNGIADYRETYALDNWKREEKCDDCTYLPLCFGGCRYSRYQHTGSMEGVECMKDFYDQTLGKMLAQDLEYR
jgi:uncharacterized protein